MYFLLKLLLSTGAYERFKCVDIYVNFPMEEVWCNTEHVLEMDICSCSVKLIKLMHNAQPVYQNRFSSYC